MNLDDMKEFKIDRNNKNNNNKKHSAGNYIETVGG